jgi:glucose-1-phosphate thymidylyltransferase
MVLWAIEALVEAGVREVMLVTGGTHAGEFLRLLGSGHEWGMERLFYAYQQRPGGIAEALGLAEQFVGRQRVIVMLADNVFGGSLRPTVERFVRQERGARLLLARVEDTVHLNHLGVARIEDGRIREIVEKPAEPPSVYAVTGLYCYDADVWNVLQTLQPSPRGELEITDVNNWYVRQRSMEFDMTDAYWGDAGESIQAYYEVNEWVRRFRASS